MEQFGVYSEVGKLRKVIVHRPELSLKRLTPSNHDDLLFDDVLWVERAQWEHDQFVAAMRGRGVQVFLLLDLLGEALAASDEGTAQGDRAGRLRVHRRLVAGGRGARVPVADEAGRAGQAPDRRPDRRRDGSGFREAQGGLARCGRAGRSGLLRAAARAEFPVHARFFVLDLQRRLGQPDVLAGPAPRIAQPAGDLPLPPDVPGRRLRVLVPGAGRRRQVQRPGLRPGVAGGRRRDAHRQRHGADRHERAHARRA